MTHDPASTFDPFAALGLPRRFDLEPGAIRQAHLARMAAEHPDLADAGDDAAADLNRARRTLEDDEARANALLTLLGGPKSDADRSLPPGFLMEIMALREAVEEAIAGGGEAARAECRADAEARRAGHIEAVAAAFAALDAGAPSAADLKSIRTELNAWRYAERLLEQLDPGYDPGRADFDAHSAGF